jgi:transcriptional repressor NrdR
MQRLKKLDKVAYVRFASVYMDFKDVKEFMNELKDLLKDKATTTKAK